VLWRQVYRTNYLPGCSAERRPTAYANRLTEADHRYKCDAHPSRLESTPRTHTSTPRFVHASSPRLEKNAVPECTRGPSRLTSIDSHSRLTRQHRTLGEPPHPLQTLRSLARPTVADHACTLEFVVGSWAELARFDDLWAEAVHARNALSAERAQRPLRVLNVSHLASLRGDAHCEDCTGEQTPDCLHFCLPGPVDTWSALLQDAVLALR
jgi:hypothetical protein